MVWQLNSHAYKKYNRNPLVAVSIELRFHPILKIGSGQAIPEYQDKIRSHFPQYQEGLVQVVNLTASPNVDIKEEKQFQFSDDETKTQLVLSVDKILLVCKDHIDRERTLGKFNHALRTLQVVCGAIEPVRIGVRYINYIDKDKISDDLKTKVEWPDLVKDEFLKMPYNLADNQDTAYMMEMSSLMQRGGMTLRYGLLRDRPEQNLSFRFDTDRYLVDKFDINDTIGFLNEFVHDIYSLFSEMRGRELEKWMDLN